MLKQRTPSEERAVLLAVATPQEWDKWLNAEAEGGADECLICKAYEGNCLACAVVERIELARGMGDGVSNYEIILPVADGDSLRLERFDFSKMTSLNEVTAVFRQVNILHKGIIRRINAGKTSIFHFSETPCDVPDERWLKSSILCVIIEKDKPISLAWHKPRQGECVKYRKGEAI